MEKIRKVFGIMEFEKAEKFLQELKKKGKEAKMVGFLNCIIVEYYEKS